jgi:hypothetical protein
VLALARTRGRAAAQGVEVLCQRAARGAVQLAGC